jgi:hypothetical protein
MEIKPLKAVKGQGLCKLMNGIEVVNINHPRLDDTVGTGADPRFNTTTTHQQIPNY